MLVCSTCCISDGNADTGEGMAVRSWCRAGCCMMVFCTQNNCQQCIASSASLEWGSPHRLMSVVSCIDDDHLPKFAELH